MISSRSITFELNLQLRRITDSPKWTLVKLHHSTLGKRPLQLISISRLINYCLFVHSGDHSGRLMNWQVRFVQQSFRGRKNSFWRFLVTKIRTGDLWSETAFHRIPTLERLSRRLIIPALEYHGTCLNLIEPATSPVYPVDSTAIHNLVYRLHSP